VLIGLIIKARVKGIGIIKAFNRLIHDIWPKKFLRIPSKMTSSMKLKLK